jgi:hypothetical protein
METIKLSEVLSRLNKTESLATDSIIVSRNGETFRTQTKDLSKATTSQAGIMGVEDKSYLETLKTWSIGSLNEFAKAGEFTMPEFNAFLNGLNYKGTNKKELKSGRYLANVGGVPLFVTFVVLHAASKKSAIWVEGCLMVTSNQISLNSETGVTIAYRTCVDATWSDWKTILDDLKSEVPTVQSSANGTNKNYIYSRCTKEKDPYTVLSAKMWMYFHPNSQALFLRFRNWGGNDDNITNDRNDWNQVEICRMASPDGTRGLMNGYVLARLYNNTLWTANTADAVVVNYTNYKESGDKKLIIEKATSAKAGVMTAADKDKLDKLSVPTINLDEIQSHWFRNNAQGVVDIDKVLKAAPLYLVITKRGTKDVVVGTLSAISDSMGHTVHLKFYTNYELNTDGTFSDAHNHDLGFPKEYVCTAGFQYSYNSEDPDLVIPNMNGFGRWYCPLDKQLKKLEDRITALEAKHK